MEEKRNLTLSLGDISFKKELGCYYIDMRNAKVHYTQNIYGGKFDDNGVPMIRTENGYTYFPINIAQYGFMLHAEYIDNEDVKTFRLMQNCLNVLEQIKHEDAKHAKWLHLHYEVKYKIEAPWPSAMAQGEVISFYLRMYQLLKDESLLNTAQKAFSFLQLTVEQGGVRQYDEYGNLWFEEYPSQPASFVLNGFIYTLFGLIDLYRITDNSIVKETIEQCKETLLNRLKDFDAGYWSYYDLQKKELVRYYYQKNVHVLQMKVLHKLYGSDIFSHYAQKWEKQLTQINFLFVRLMYRVKPRLDKIKRVVK